MKTFFDWLVYAFARVFFFSVGVAPRPWAYRFCRAVANVVYLLDARHRRIGMVNLAIAFPERSESWRRSILKKSFRQLGDLAVEISRLARPCPEDVKRRVQYEPGRGLENYLAAKSDTLGVVFVTAHISAWELLPIAHALHGHPLTFVVRPLDNPFLERWMGRLRSQSGNHAIDKRNSVRDMFRTLKAGGDIGILIDQNIQPREAVFTPLFGRPAATTPAPASLALKTGAAVVIGFLIPVQERPGHYRIRFYPPLRFPATGDRKAAVQDATARFNHQIEEVLREYPHCWLWGHRRFSAQPPGFSNPYESGARK